MTEQAENMEYINIQIDPDADLSYEEMKAMLDKVDHNLDVLQSQRETLADRCGWRRGQKNG